AGERLVPPEYVALWERLNNWGPHEISEVTVDGKMIAVEIKDILPNRSTIDVDAWVCGTPLIQDAGLLREAM
ncbi:MAG: hypothetical protein MK186_11255, partial [Henriciella sp.]|nr:hypothetical protein [Henriciella sp.]